MKTLRNPTSDVMYNKDESCGYSEAAIVCHHIAEEGYPILQAVRTEPVDHADSGWQFLCNSGRAEDDAPARVWSIAEVVEREPSLIRWLNVPFGSGLWRSSTTHPWKEYLL